MKSTRAPLRLWPKNSAGAGSGSSRAIMTGRRSRLACRAPIRGNGSTDLFPARKAPIGFISRKGHAMPSTFGHAVRLGGGAMLTNGHDRFMISDWSIGTGDVYGWRMRKDGTRGAYC